jgi:hypothetical protein
MARDRDTKINWLGVSVIAPKIWAYLSIRSVVQDRGWEIEQQSIRPQTLSRPQPTINPQLCLPSEIESHRNNVTQGIITSGKGVHSIRFRKVHIPNNLSEVVGAEGVARNPERSPSTASKKQGSLRRSLHVTYTTSDVRFEIWRDRATPKLHCCPVVWDVGC